MQCKNCQKDLEVTEYVCTNCGNIIWENIIADAKEKKEDAIACLMEKTQNKLYYTVYRYVKNQGLAEDIVQETYIKALDSLDSLSDANKFESWITTIAVNRSKNYLGVKKNTEFVDFTSMEEEGSDLLFEESIENETMSFEPEANFNYSELKDGLNSVLDELPDNQRMAILLYYLDEFKVKEISEIMDIPQGSVKSLLNYGRTAIKKKIEELRKQNKSFYSIAAFPFLGWMLKDQVKSIKISAKMTDAIMKSVGVNQGISAAQTATSAKAITTAAAKGISTKVVAGVVAGVVTAGAIGGYVLANQSSQPAEPKEEKVVEEDDNTTKYSVLDVEVPDFEFAPISLNGYKITTSTNETYENLDNEYLLASVDNQFGILDSNNEWIIEPLYSKVEYSIMSQSITLSNDLKNSNDTIDQYGITHVLNGGAGAFPIRIVEENGELKPYFSRYDFGLNKEILDPFYMDASKTGMCWALYNDEWYLIDKNAHLYGPYQLDEAPCYEANLLMPTSSNNKNNYYTFGYMCPFHSMFYALEDGKYRIYNEDASNKSSQLYDEITILSNNWMQVKRDDQIFYIDSNLNEFSFKELRDVSISLNGKAYAKINDEWKMIELEK